MRSRRLEIWEGLWGAVELVLPRTHMLKSSTTSANRGSTDVISCYAEECGPLPQSDWCPYIKNSMQWWEPCCHKPRTIRRRREGWKRFFLSAFEGRTALPMPCCQPPNLQNCEPINFHCRIPSVRGALLWPPKQTDMGAGENWWIMGGVAPEWQWGSRPIWSGK